MTADLTGPKSLLRTACHVTEAVLPASEVPSHTEQVFVV